MCLSADFYISCLVRQVLVLDGFLFKYVVFSIT